MDNGGEFFSKAFDDYCKHAEIVRQKTTPYNPQQNGVAKRMNKTLIDRAQSMLSSVNLEQRFWAEVVHTACYLVNRSPTSALVDKTPYEVWTGKHPLVSHFRVFGSETYVHVSKEKHYKLDFKANKCLLLGYGENIKGYKLWDPIAMKMLYSKDVIFRELKEFKNEQPQVKPKKIVHFDIKVEPRKDTQVEQPQEDAHVEQLDEHEGEEGLEENPKDEQLEHLIRPQRRSTRQRKPIDRYGYSPFDFHCVFVLSCTDNEPRFVKEALSSDKHESW